MLIYNTMRFGTDVFTVTDGDNPVIGSREALLISADALDASNVSAVNKFVISGKTASKVRNLPAPTAVSSSKSTTKFTNSMILRSSNIPMMSLSITFSPTATLQTRLPRCPT